MNPKIIKVANDFSISPLARLRDHGGSSGEAFREDLLYPALRASQKVVVDFSGTIGAGSSFLEEAFGGLVRKHGMRLAELRERLDIVGGTAFNRERIWQYIAEADKSIKAR